MKKITVLGGSPLNGEITVSGSKNAALPIIFSCILTKGVSEIENLPDIGDVRSALSILREMGAAVRRSGDVTYIDTSSLTYVTPSERLVSSIRASTYLLGSCLSRFGRCDLMPFGGCAFASRPIDLHLSACKSFGAQLRRGSLASDGLCGANIDLSLPSVGATVNAILLAASAKGESRIGGCAVEPHIDALIAFLNSCGADIKRQDREIFVKGRRLHGGKIRVIGDYVEAGSYLVASLILGGDLSVRGCPTEDMSAVLDALRLLGAEIDIRGDCIRARLEGKSRRFKITAEPYPGFPTDLQPIFAPLMARFSGGEIEDTVWPTRFGYLKTLSSFGVDSAVFGSRAIVYPSRPRPAVCTAPDLRGGFSCLMLALLAEGESVISSADIILRGYADLEKKLSSAGARIKIEKTNFT